METLFYAVRKRVEGTGLADEADVQADGFAVGRELRTFASLGMTSLPRIQKRCGSSGANGRCATRGERGMRGNGAAVEAMARRRGCGRR